MISYKLLDLEKLIHRRHLGFRLGALIRYAQSIRNASCAVETTDDGLEEDNIQNYLTFFYP